MAFDDGVKTVSGSVASVLDGAEKVPVESCVLSLDASLTGYSQATLKQTGKNMLNPTTCQRGYITANGSIASPGTVQQELYSDYIKVKPNTTYTFSATVSNSSEKWRGFAYYDKDKNFISRYAGVVGNVEHFSATNKTPATTMYIRCTWRNYSDISSGGSVCPCQLEEGSETSYEEFSIDNKTAQFGRTIHGGTAEFINGVGQDYTLWVDMSTIKWSEDPNRPGVFYGAVTGRKTASADEPSDVLSCTCYTVNNVNVTTGIDKYISGARSYGGTYIFFRDSAFSGYTREQVQEALQGEKVCVISATPTDFTFTPVAPTPETEERCHFWHESGDTSVTYHDNAHGFDSVTVIKTTRNLFDDKHLNVGLPGTSIGSYIDTINTTATGYTYNGFVPPHGNVVIKGSGNDANVVASCLFFGYKNGYLTEYRSINPYGNYAVVVDCSTFDYVRLSVGAKSGYQAPTDMTEYGYVQAEAGSVIHDYEPYVAPVSKTAYLHKVVYAGEVDVIKGTAKPKNLLANLGTFPFSGSENNAYYLDFTSIHPSRKIPQFRLQAGVNYTLSFDVECNNEPFNVSVGCGSTGAYLRDIASFYNNTSGRISVTFSVSQSILDTYGDIFAFRVPRYGTKQDFEVTVDNVQLEIGTTASEYVPHFDPFTFPPISIGTDEGENTLFANEGASAITYRKETD